MTEAEELAMLREYAEIRTCPHCGAEFATARNQKQKYCSLRCNTAAKQADYRRRNAKD